MKSMGNGVMANTTAFTRTTERFFTLMRTDQSYRESWKANIAMAFNDELYWSGYKFPDQHSLTNRAADRFIKLLLSNDTDTKVEA